MYGLFSISIISFIYRVLHEKRKNKHNDIVNNEVKDLVVISQPPFH